MNFCAIVGCSNRGNSGDKKSFYCKHQGPETEALSSRR